jgi:hypothetical protein
MSQNPTLPVSRHQFFILGLWAQPGRPGRPVAWRISLENPQTAERKGFVDLADLDAFLAAWMAERASVDLLEDSCARRSQQMISK